MLLSSFSHAAAWLVRVEANLPRRARKQLVAHSLTKKRTLVFSAMASLWTASIAVAVSQAPWAYIWIASELVLFGARLASVAAYENAERSGRDGNALLPIASGLTWIVQLSIAYVFCVLSNDWLLIFLAGIGVAGIVGGVSSRNAGTPRYAIVVIFVLTLPYCLALATSGLGYSLGMSIQLLAGAAGMLVVLQENHKALVDLYRAEHENYQLARYDPLTGLYNRRTERESLERMVERARGAPRDQSGDAPHVLYLDLDGFKQVNDRYGHAAGDRALQVIARRLLENVRPNDLVFRSGGDEFVVLLPTASDAEGTSIARRLIDCVAWPVALGFDEPTLMGVSIGGARFPRDGDTAEELMRNADRALYRAKQHGKGCYATPAGEVVFVDRADLSPTLEAGAFDETRAGLARHGRVDAVSR